MLLCTVALPARGTNTRDNVGTAAAVAVTTAAAGAGAAAARGRVRLLGCRVDVHGAV